MSTNQQKIQSNPFHWATAFLFRMGSADFKVFPRIFKGPFFTL